MKNLELLYAQIEGKALTFDQYLTLTSAVIYDQAVFKLESKSDQTGWVLQSDDGSYHVWFMTRSIDTMLRYVVETSTHHASQLTAAINDLLQEMKIRCEDLLNQGLEIDDDGIPV